MKKFLNLFSAVLVCLVLNQTIAHASSHREAPLISTDPIADNTDLYAFKSPCDTNNIVLIANYIPFELPQGGPNWYTFGSNVRYEIHVDNNAANAGDEIIYRFTFSQVNEDATTFFNIRLGKQNLKTTYTLERSMDGGTSFTTVITNGVVPPPNIGPRSIESSPVGLGTNYDTLAERAVTMASTGEKVFCGPRDDPFFVDLGGAFDVGGFRSPGRDGLEKFNCHSIVVEVPVATLQKAGKPANQATSILDGDFVIGVWASASRPEITTFDTTGGAPAVSGNWIQVSRLGMPLTNEAVIPIGYKDVWNATLPTNDLQFAKYFNNPELGLYMDDSAFGGAVPGLSALRIQSKSLGAFDFRNGKKGLYGLKGSDAVKGTALDDALYGTILLPDSVSPRAVDLLPIFYTGVPNVRPYQLATGKGGNPLAAGKPFINNFLPTLGDKLRLNMAVPVTPRNDPKFSSLGIVTAAVLGLTDTNYNKSAALQFIPNMDGFPNGRRLEDDVTTIELQAVSGVALAAIGLWYDDYVSGGSGVTQQLGNVIGFNAGVTQNDTAFRPCFPYVQTPWRGFRGASYVGPLISLPVNFVGFVAQKGDGKAELKWYVSNEVNNDHYEVERSIDGVKYIKIGTVKARNGDRNTYELTDYNPEFGRNIYYRIRQVDKDGRFSYSAVRTLKFTHDLLTMTPNPATDFIKIASKETGITVNLYNVSGQRVISQVLASGNGDINISRLSKGTYLVVAEKNGIRVQTQKVVKQ